VSLHGDRELVETAAPLAASEGDESPGSFSLSPSYSTAAWRSRIERRHHIMATTMEEVDQREIMTAESLSGEAR
jgi:hypothetical protein